MKNMYLWISLFMLMASAGMVQAQTAEQRARLLELSAQYKQEFQEKNAAALRWAAANNVPVRTEHEDGRTTQLMYLDENGMPVYYTTFNAEGAEVINSDKVYPAGGAGLSLTGAGQTLGMWDGGDTRDTHVELTGRVTNHNAVSSLGTSNHATHVAGTMIGAGAWANARGMSYEANLDAYDWNNDESEMAAAAAAGMKVSQHSYGQITGWAEGNWSGTTGWHWFGHTGISETEEYRWGFYSTQAKDWDEIAHNAPNYLIVKSAGNDRNLGPTPGTGHYVRNPSAGWTWEWSTTTRDVDGGGTGLKTISEAGVSKNVLTVGAVDASKNMSGFSGWGPTDDGRVKPDIVAKGVAVLSPVAFDGVGSPSDIHYGSYNGTSMSGPMVSGSIGLLLQHQENLHPGEALLSSTKKALVLHTAEDLGRPGPDYEYGWGLMNTEAATAVMTAHATDGIHIFERTLNEGDEFDMLVKATGTEPLRATLVWTDVPGTPPTPSLNPPDLMLVNDLDMRLTQMGGATFEPFVLDPDNPTNNATTGDNTRDNVEVVHIASPLEDGLYSLSITHKGSLSGGSQQFSLIVTGNKEVDEVYIAQSQDNASNYGGTWDDGDNEGYGFDTWSFTAGGSGGRYIGSTGLGDPTFGIYAGGDQATDFFVATRDFHGPIPVGTTISFDLGYTGVANGGEIGASFFADGAFRFTVKFIGGDSEWKLNDGGSDFGTGISWSGGTPMNISLTRGEDNKYSIVISQGAQNFTGTDYTANSGSFAIDRIEFFSKEQGNGENLGFNNLNIEPDFTAIPATASAKIIGKVQLDDELELNDLIIEAGHELAVSPGINLTVNDNLHNFAGSGNFVLESDNTATASLMHPTDDVPATLQRYIAGSANATTTQYHQVSVPLTQTSNPTAALFMDAYLMFWNPVSDEWQWITNPSDLLDVDKGYMIWYTGTETTLNFEGNLNNGSFTASVPSNGAGQHSLVPNPYPSAIDWDGTGWTKTNLDDAVYIWSRDINNYMGYGSDQSINGGSRYIAAGQAFVVAANGAAAGLQMTNDVRLHNPIPFRDNTDETDVLRIAAGGTYGADELVIRLHENATPNFDGHTDLRKMFGGANAPQLYARSADTELLSVYSLPYSGQVQTVEIGFEMGTDDEPVLHFSGLESFENSATLMLEDRYTQRMYDLRDLDSLPFAHAPSGNGIRFLLHLYGPTALEAVSPPGNSRIWQSGDHLYLDAPERVGELALISLHNALGSTLMQTEIRMEAPTVINIGRYRGLVVVRISTDAGSETHKMVIQ